MADPAELDDDELNDDLDDDDDEDEDEDEASSRSSTKPSAYDRRLAHTLNTLRKQEGHSLRSFAALIRPTDPDETWNKSKMQRVLNAHRRFTITELVDLCQALNVAPRTILEEARVIERGETRSIIDALRLDPALTAKSRDWMVETYQNLTGDQR